MGTVALSRLKNYRRLIPCAANRQGRDNGIFSGLDLGIIIVSKKSRPVPAYWRGLGCDIDNDRSGNISTTNMS